ncbi:hypothetical protein MTO96_032888 [Rhipicephalus appendiculatus]
MCLPCCCKQLKYGQKDEGELLRAFFDGGSQRSFVTKKLSRELQLEVIGEEDITIYPFGGSGNIIKGKRRRVKIWRRSQCDRNEHFIEALEIQEICSDQLRIPEDIMQKTPRGK